MRHLLERYSKMLIRPILYRSVLRGSIALAAVLVWNRFANKAGFLSMRRDAFLVAGIFFLAMAWFVYLRLDNVKVPRLPKREKKKVFRHSYGDIIDFADEHIVSFDELDDGDQDLCRFAADLILGVLFVLASVLSFSG